MRRAIENIPRFGAFCQKPKPDEKQNDSNILRIDFPVFPGMSNLSSVIPRALLHFSIAIRYAAAVLRTSGFTSFLS